MNVIDKIRNAELYVKCSNDDEVEKLLDILNRDDFVWDDGESLLEYAPFIPVNGDLYIGKLNNDRYGLTYFPSSYVKNEKYSITYNKFKEEYDKMEKGFTKDDLKTGMWVKTRNNIMYLVLKDYKTCKYGEGMFIDEINQFLVFGEYRDDLKHVGHEDYDIVQVFKPIGDAFVLDVDRLMPIWTRKEKPKLPPQMKGFFELLNQKYKKYWIAKDKNGSASIYQSKPKKANEVWEVEVFKDTINITKLIDNSFFDWLSWSDEEPSYIPDLLAECEVTGGKN